MNSTNCCRKPPGSSSILRARSSSVLECLASLAAAASADFCIRSAEMVSTGLMAGCDSSTEFLLNVEGKMAGDAPASDTVACEPVWVGNCLAPKENADGGSDGGVGDTVVGVKENLGSDAWTVSFFCSGAAFGWKEKSEVEGANELVGTKELANVTGCVEVDIELLCCVGGRNVKVGFDVAMSGVKCSVATVGVVVVLEKAPKGDVEKLGFAAFGSTADLTFCSPKVIGGLKRGGALFGFENENRDGVLDCIVVERFAVFDAFEDEGWLLKNGWNVNGLAGGEVGFVSVDAASAALIFETLSVVGTVKGFAKGDG